MSLKRLFPLVLGPQEAGSRAFPLDSELEASHTQHHCHLPPLLGDLCFHGHLALLALQSVPVKDFRGIKTDRPPQSQISLLFFVYSLATRSVFSRRALEHGAHGIGLDDALRFSRHRRRHDRPYSHHRHAPPCLRRFLEDLGYPVTTKMFRHPEPLTWV